MTRFEASVYLRELYEEAIVDFELEDNRVDFYSLLVENTRNEHSPSSYERGHKRGNKHNYGYIDRIKVGTRKMFSRSKLREWFDESYLVQMIMIT